MRRDLNLWTERRYNEKVNGYEILGKDPFDEDLEKEIRSLRRQLKNCRYHKHEMD